MPGTLSRVIEVVGIPFDLCGKRSGSRLGPAAARLAGLGSVLQDLGLDVHDAGDLDLPAPAAPSGGLRHFSEAIDCLRATKRVVSGALDSGSLPLIVGGDHSISIGTLSAAIDRYGSKLGVLWIDAHTDLNTPGTSPSGDLHGMPLAALLGIGSSAAGDADRDWRLIQSEIVPESRLSPRQTAWIGLRDVDPGEKRHLERLDGEFTATMYDVDRYGMVEVVVRFDEWIRRSGAEALWISFDVDALDPFLAPGTGTAVRGGLTYREMHLMGEMLCELMQTQGCPYPLAGVDLVEINPLIDTNNATAVAAVEWVGSLFGKTILGKR